MKKLEILARCFLICYIVSMQSTHAMQTTTGFNMQTRNTTTTIQVFINFEHKDLFKSFFKTAKWDSVNRCWVVALNKANENKLAKFATEIEAAETASKEAEEQEATEKEIAQMQAEIAQHVAKTKELIASRAAQAELTAKLAAIKNELETAKKEMAEVAAAAEAEKQANVATLNAVLNTYSFEGNSVAQMQKLMRVAFQKRDVSTFEPMRKFLKEAYDEIKEKTGIKFLAIFEMGRANINRPDRDMKYFSMDIFGAANVEFN